VLEVVSLLQIPIAKVIRKVDVIVDAARKRRLTTYVLSVLRNPVDVVVKITTMIDVGMDTTRNATEITN